MKLTLQHVHVRSTDALDSAVEERILLLGEKIVIEEARVRLECRFHESPAYVVWIHVVTPGPDLEAEGRDHTLQAAVRKAFVELEERIKAKQDRRHLQERNWLERARPGLGRVGV